MKLLVGFLYFSASRAAAARKVFVGRPVPVRNKSISARPAGRATGRQAARNGPRAPHL
jgi:hypothetical protein